MSDISPAVFRREPYPEEVAAARAEIQNQELAISALDQKIQGLMAQITLARIAQGRHREVIARCKAVTTLARRLPEELLAKIFECCTIEGWTFAPMVVSQVCSSWRRAAMSPRVWSYVYVDGNSADAVDRTRFWLSRVKHAPLHPAFVITWSSLWLHLSRNMELLRRHSSQWETLTFTSETVSQAWDLIEQCTFPMPNLKEIKATLEVQFHPALDGEPELLSLARIFTVECAPRLRSVSLTCNALPNDLTIPAHIASLSLNLTSNPEQRPNSASRILDILESLPNLTQLFISLPTLSSEPYIPELDGDRMVSLNELTTLTFHGLTDLSGFLDHLRAPSLRHLHIRADEETNLQHQPLALGPTLLQFLQGSDAAVELLELHDVDLTPEFFSACFSRLPSLRELRLHESSISDMTLELLDKLCPMLNRIDLRWCGMVSGQALVKLVRGRNFDRTGAPRSKFAMPGSFIGDSDETSHITEVAVLNCSLVKEKDVLDLARMTVCRVKMRDDDHCRPRQCCSNGRYRQRLRLRHMSTFAAPDRSQFQLIV
ncbi:hypothetical protein BC835DRAFT_1268573 [Cytidiella melzeri]|nr:hypothetical protein BC835DRAFT_1268573 [Cytidiella melzeri]